MIPKTTEDPQNRLFMQRLDTMIDMDHELVRLADMINWKIFEKKLGEVYIPDKGRPGLPTRLMAGLHYLKGMHNLSDERVTEMFLENPYWQYFCGMEYFVTKMPLDPSSMTRWRKRVGPRGFEAMLKETVETALSIKCIKPKDLDRVTVDTTVQEKSITFPTDIGLYAKGIELIVRLAKRAGIKLRQSYAYTVPKLLRQYWHSQRSRHYKQAAACVRKVKTILGRTLRDAERHATPEQLSGRLGKVIAMAQKVLTQKRGDKNKLYSYFEPETSCIAKGKTSKKYEFGCKASITATQQGNVIVGMQTYDGCPNDVTTLKGALIQTSEITGRYPREVYCDKGYRGKARHSELDCEIFIPGMKSQPSVSCKKRLKRRNAIEPIIGHLKSDYGMDRNNLSGRMGDEINALMAACGFNMMKLLKQIITILCLIAEWLIMDTNSTKHRNWTKITSPSIGLAC